MVGGVALNCTANGRLLQSGIFDEIYVQPAAGDDGTALGAALWRGSRNGGVRNYRFPVPFIGPAATQAEIDAAIAETGDRIQATRFATLEEACAEGARLIKDGRVLGWYRGRMEFGPRALGHRSIVADPGHPEMRDRINAMVKMREAFRPFAPAVSLEQVQDWFEVPKGFELPYMIMVADVRPQFRDQLPAITHVNGSARVQTVSSKDNLEFHTLLRAVGKLTRREMRSIHSSALASSSCSSKTRWFAAPRNRLQHQSRISALYTLPRRHSRSDSGTNGYTLLFFQECASPFESVA